MSLGLVIKRAADGEHLLFAAGQLLAAERLSLCASRGKVSRMRW